MKTKYLQPGPREDIIDVFWPHIMKETQVSLFPVIGFLGTTKFRGGDSEYNLTFADQTIVSVKNCI